MEIFAQTLTITVGIMVLILLVAELITGYFTMKNEIKNYKRFEKQVGVLLDALDRKLPQSKVIEIKDYMKAKTA